MTNHNAPRPGNTQQPDRGREQHPTQRRRRVRVWNRRSHRWTYVWR